MTSTHALQLTTQILQDTTAAVPLLQLLYAFATSGGDPLSEAMVHDVMMLVWTKVPTCEEGMISFLMELESSPTQKAA